MFSRFRRHIKVNRSLTFSTNRNSNILVPFTPENWPNPMQNLSARKVHRRDLFGFDALEWSILLGGIVIGSLMLLLL